MDLTNNLGFEHVKEFHVVDFEVHKAPGSPPGRLHSTHPIGLSALLVPAYWIGSNWWSNPRLACALSMNPFAAACVALVFLWLVRLGQGRGPALACAGIVATTSPLFPYCNQLYPDLPALLILMIFLVVFSHWQLPGGRYRSLGPREPAILGGLTLLLTIMLFLHSRFLPLVALLAFMLVLQVRHSQARRESVRAIGLAASASFFFVLWYNYSFSGDFFGPFLPGNALDGDALKLSTWLISLPGQWLHSTAGLLNSSPVFVASALGLISLAFLPDTRRWQALALYLLTAGVNGLHPNWMFGFCFPARFMLTALPVLIYGFSLFLPLIKARPIVMFLVGLSLTASWDTLLTLFVVPEAGFGGEHLLWRAIEHYYPLSRHFVSFSQTYPWSDLFCWVALSSAFYLLLVPSHRTALHFGAVITVLLLPWCWGHTEGFALRLPEALLPQLPSEDYAFGKNKMAPPRMLEDLHRTTTGDQQVDSTFVARNQQHAPGILASYFTGYLPPGTVKIDPLDLQFDSPPGVPAGHLILFQYQSMPVYAPWGVHNSHTLQTPPDGTAELTAWVPHLTKGYAYAEFSGQGNLEFHRFALKSFLFQDPLTFSEIARYPAQPETSPGVRQAFRCTDLDEGHYRVQFDFAGASLASLFEPDPAPLHMAIYFVPGSSAADQVQVQSQLMHWFTLNPFATPPKQRADLALPQVESIQPSWWASIPLASSHFYSLDFFLPAQKEAWFLVKYSGKDSLRLSEVRVSKAN